MTSGHLLGELPATALQLTEVINAPGSIEVTIPNNPALLPGLSEHDLEEGATTLYVERDGVILQPGCILWSTEITLGGQDVILRGEGFHSYFRRRLLRTNLSFPPTSDRALILKTLLDHAQAQDGGDIGIRTDLIRPLGATSERNYLGYERKTYGHLIELLTDDQYGFCFRYVSRWDAARSRISTHIEIIPPGVGPNELVFDLARNCALAGRVIRDGTLRANRADATGDGNGDEMLIETAVNPHRGRLPLLDRVESYYSITERTTLRGKAEALLLRGAESVIVPTLTVDPDADPRLGSYGTGHSGRFVAQLGLLDIDAAYLVSEIRLTVSETGEDVQVSLATDIPTVS
ncbi:hypothetical protein [Longimycelium tulufanense]|uniref:hypothetical protein n=1 Tax=Longimycelium tulufanense TaxID=907463 RepID=UPI00166CEB3B|nr:hypothetical protein [Longimycelium tulufanense]